TYYDWQFISHDTPASTHMHFIFQNVGKMPNVGDVSWMLDNVDLEAATIPPFSLMLSQPGYDLAGPQWLALVGDDVAYRNTSTPFSKVTWELWDPGASSPFRTMTSTAPGQPCFQDITDLEHWNYLPATNTYDFTHAPLFWWVWNVAPQVVDEHHGCYAKA